MEKFQWVGKDSWCGQVTCTAPECKKAGTCSAGKCSDPSNGEDGAECNDGDGDTVKDQCKSGSCVGEDPCEGVTCPASDSCHEAGKCKSGNCFAGDAVKLGSPCDDENKGTANDVCVKDGNHVVCQGTKITTTKAPTTTDVCYSSSGT